MIRSLLLTLALCLFAIPAFAITFGPPQPETKGGEVSFGPGFFFESGDLDDGTDFESTQGYVQLSIGLADSVQIYLAGGGADLTVEAIDDFDKEDFEAGYQAFGGAGIKILLHDTKEFGFGVFAQGAYFDDYEDTKGGTIVEVTSQFEVSGGFGLQTEIEGALLYGGPFFSLREADVARDGADAGNFEEDDGFGFFAGIRWPVKENFHIGIEAQKRSGVAGGGTLSYTF